MRELPSVQGQYMERVGDSALISIGRNSLVYFDKVDGKTVVAKSYSPSRNSTYDRRYAGCRKHPLLGLFASDSERLHMFRAEAAILNASQSLPTDVEFPPKLVGVHIPTRTIYMEKVEALTFRDYIIGGNNIKSKTKELVEVLVRLHSIFGQHFEELYREISFNDEAFSFLKVRNKEEEYLRWTKYFKTIIYRTSREFADFFPLSQPRGRNIGKKAVKKALRNFLDEKKINLEEQVRDFIDRDWYISFGDEFRRKKYLISPQESKKEQQRALRRLYNEGLISIVHGDFMPQNIFNVPQGVKVCDFTEMRLDRREVDLASALYNIYNAPSTSEQEANALEMIGRYAEMVHDQEKINLDPRLLVIRNLEARLKYVGVGLFAIDCKYVPEEILMFVQGWDKFPAPKDEEELETSFLEKMFSERFQHFADYLLRQEGWGNLYTLPHAEDLRKQMEVVEKIFIETGVFAATPAARRAGRIAETIGDPRACK
ncbi:MAG TPA: hypothetical protein VJI32_05670 [Candidatus Nanoarchaeia archaeon]|nr:hypothetical protein [Candidatus Nanoarchaeia archaeon]